jgi:ribosomal protein S17
MRKIAYLLLAFVLIFSFSCKKGKKSKDKEEPQIDTLVTEQPVLPFEEEVSTSDSDSTAVVDTSTTESDQVYTIYEQTQKKTPVPDQQVEQQQGNIYIIVGSFRKYPNAVKTKTFYEKFGYTPQILPQVAGHYRVAVESFTDLTTARQRLHELRKKFKRPDFWLLYQK